MAEFTTDDGIHVVSSDPLPEPQAPGQTATPADTPADTPAPADPAPAPPEDDEPIPRGVQRRIDQLVARIHNTERELSAERARNETRERLQQPQTPAAPPVPAGPPVRPRDEEYATREEYLAAEDAYLAEMVDYRIGEREGRSREQAQAQAQAASDADALAATRAREAEVIKAHPNYYDRVDQLRPMLAPQVLWGLQRAGEDGPDVALYLADHPEELQPLNQTPVHLIGHAIGRIARKATGGQAPQGSNGTATATEPTASPTRLLPEPPQPVGGSGATVTPGYRDDWTQDQFDAWAKRTYPGMAYTHRR